MKYKDLVLKRPNEAEVTDSSQQVEEDSPCSRRFNEVCLRQPGCGLCGVTSSEDSVPPRSQLSSAGSKYRDFCLQETSMNISTNKFSPTQLQSHLNVFFFSVHLKHLPFFTASHACTLSYRIFTSGTALGQKPIFAIVHWTPCS